MALDEYVLFEREISKGIDEETLFVRLTCEKDFEIAFSYPKYVKMYEVLSTGSPYVIIDFVDAIGAGTNANKIDTNAIFTLYFGRTLEESRSMRMKIAKVDHSNGIGGKSTHVGFSIHFVHESWNSFIHKTHNRGWSNIKYSDVIAQIASESGFNVLGIADTRLTKELVTQTNTSNHKLLKKIIASAMPVAGSNGHFEFGVDLEGNFFCLPVSDLIKKAHESRTDRPPSENRGEIPLFRMDGHPANVRERKDLKNKDNAGYPYLFSSYEVKEDYMPMMMRGAGGITTMYYDFDSGEYRKKNNTLSSSDFDQLSEWSVVHPDDEVNNTRLYGGRDPDTEVKGTNLLSNSTNSVQKVKIKTEGTPFIKIGDIVEVIIPNPPDMYSEPYNETYSGFYMVSGVEHMFRLHKRTAYSNILTLTRHGVDKKDLDGYARSSKGKVTPNS